MIRNIDNKHFSIYDAVLYSTYWLFVSLLICSPFLLGCQSVSTEKSEITRLLQQADNLLDSNCIESLEYAKRASLMAEKTKDSKLKAEAYYYVAYTLNILEEYERSLPYIEMGLAEKAAKRDHTLKARLLALKGFHYSRLHLYKQQAKQAKEVFDLTGASEQPESIMTAAFALASLGISYTIPHDYPAAHFHNQRAINHAEKVNDSTYQKLKKIYKTKANLLYYRAMTYIEQFKPSEAYPFIQKAYKQAQIDQRPLSLFLELFGDYYAQLDNYEKAIGFYLDALTEKQKRIWNRSTSADLYLKISKSYARIKKFKEEEKYLKLSASERLIDESNNRKRVQAILENIEKEEIILRQQETKRKLYIALVFSMTLILFLLKYREFRLHRKKLLLEKEAELQQKAQLIETLEMKVNESFSELIELAKKNSPAFWPRFQEVHPKFLKRMLCIDTNFKSTELILCAYIYLGFSTKEIADYTYKATKTIENNRYNLRKKLGLTHEEDLILWLRNHVDDNTPTGG